MTRCGQRILFNRLIEEQDLVGAALGNIVREHGWALNRASVEAAITVATEKGPAKTFRTHRQCS